MRHASSSSLRPVSLVGIALLVMAIAAGSFGGVAQDATPATSPDSPLEVAINDVSGEEIGTATFTENDDTITIVVETGGLPPGEHGIHIHAMGMCDPSGDQPFTTAGPHYNPTGGMHGDAPGSGEVATPGGDPTIHAGDFGNLTVGEDGTGSLELKTSRFTLSDSSLSLFDMDGSALVIHEQADDLESQPAGDSGGRIACGVIAAPMEGAQPASPVASPMTSEVDVRIVNPEQVPFSDDLLDQLQVPEGFEISVYSQGLDGPRMMAFGPDGTLYVTQPLANSVIGLRDTDGDGQVDESIPAASNLPLVHGILFHEGTVFLAGENQVWTTEVADDGTFGETETILDNLPDGGQHPRRTIGIGPDGMLYVSIGSTCNSCVEPNPESATIIRSALDGSGREIFAKGLRNTLGFDWNPETGELWGWDHGSDFRGSDLPPDELNQIAESGNYGWPYCFGDQQPDMYQPYEPAGATLEQYCANTEAPVIPYQAHSAPIDFLFYSADQFPAEYQGDAFVAMRGSWNRAPAVGYELVHVDFEDGQPVSAEPLVSGWLLNDGAGQFARIAGVAVTPDGSLLISDDTNGVIYQLTYAG